MADAQKRGWIEATWDEGVLDRELQIELRTRADAYRGMIETDYERFCAVLDEEPQAEVAD